MHILHPTAIVIEPDLVAADALSNVLTSWGFTVGIFSSHAEAADAAAAARRIDLLVAGTAGTSEDQPGWYLSAARARQQDQLPTVLIVPEPGALWPAAPSGAVRLVKPFTHDELLGSVLNSLATSRLETEVHSLIHGSES